MKLILWLFRPIIDKFDALNTRIAMIESAENARHQVLSTLISQGMGKTEKLRSEVQLLRDDLTHCDRTLAELESAVVSQEMAPSFSMTSLRIFEAILYARNKYDRDGQAMVSLDRDTEIHTWANRYLAEHGWRPADKAVCVMMLCLCDLIHAGEASKV